MKVDRITKHHTFLKYYRVFVILVLLVLYKLLINTEGRPLLIFIPIYIIMGEIIFFRPNRYEIINRPKSYEITSKELIFDYYDKRQIKILIDEVTEINVMITEIDNVLLEIIGSKDEIVFMYSDDFKNFPIVFDSFLKIAINAKKGVYNCYCRRSVASKRKELLSDKSLLEILNEIDEKIKNLEQRKNRWNLTRWLLNE